jgi:hypothetical protein
MKGSHMNRLLVYLPSLITLLAITGLLIHGLS